MKTLLAFLLACLFALALNRQQISSDTAVFPDTALARQHLQQANDAFQKGQMDAALDGAAKALAIYETAPELFPLEIATALQTQARAMFRKKQFAASIAASRRSIDLRLPRLGAQAPELANNYVTLGNCYKILVRLDSALVFFQKALAIRLAAYGENHLDVAVAYNNLGIAYADQSRFDSAIGAHEKALAIRLSLFGETSSEVAQSHFNLGQANRFLRKPLQSLPHFETCEAICRKLGKPQDLQRLANCLYEQAVCYSYLMRSQKALDLGKQALEMQLEILGEKDPTTAITYELLGMENVAIGNVEEGLSCMKHAATILLRTKGENSLEMAIHHIHLGMIWQEQMEWEKAAAQFQKSIAALENLKVKYEDQAFSWSQLSFVLAQMNDLAGAERAAHAGIEVVRLHVPENKFALANLYFVLANILRKKGDPEEEKYRELALASSIENFGERNPSVAICLRELGAFHAGRKNWQKALEYSRREFEALGFGQDPEAAKRLPNSGYVIPAFTFRFSLLTALAEAENDETYWLEAKKIQDAELEIIENVQAEFTDLSDRMRLVEKAHKWQFFERAVETDLHLGDPAGAFLMAEKSKAQALLSGIQKNASLPVAGIPQELLEKESALQADLAYFSNRVFQSQGTADSVHIPDWNSILFKNRQKLLAQVKDFEENYPAYHGLKYRTTLAGVPEIQNRLLDPATALLEYFLGDSSIYVFTLTKSASDGLRLDRLPKPKDFDAVWENLRTYLTDVGFRSTEFVLDSFAEASAKLYDWLLAKPLASLDPGVKNLIIVPDGELGYLPFDLLGKASRSQTGTSADFKTFDYLLRRFNVSYAYSANLLLEQAQRAAEAPGDLEIFGGFAPAYENDDTLDLRSQTRGEMIETGKYDLPGARLEVQEIAELLGGQAYLAEAASEHNFKQNSQRFRILHLAMHTVLEDRNPLFSKLLFTQAARDGEEDNDLNAMELYAMRLPAQLAVLSACETGIGKVRRGEGILSLSRAFTYAGVPATLMSLWRADDETTRQVMVSFYQNLKAGMRKDEALRQAKLAFLEGCEAKNASPFFWAGFVAAGEMGAIFK